MATITVHSFEVPDIIEGCLVKAKGKATQEKIKSLYGEIIPYTAQDIDESLLNKTGRYHEKSN